MSTRIEKYDVAVVGAGIAGLGAAWAAHKRGLKTLLLERHAFAQGASIRNFGMLWPLGQPAGELRDLAMRNRQLWIEFSAVADIWLQACGSLHLAHHDDEWQVLQEFVRLPSERDQQLHLLSPQETLASTPLANPDGLRGALYSPHECRVAPRQAISAAASYLNAVGVEIRFDEPVIAVEDQVITSSTGGRWRASQIFVCSGADFAYLFPREHRTAKLRQCKLHMLRTRPLAGAASIGPHLASGLTLRRYESFQACPSVSFLKERIAATAPELNHYGIHAMVSQDAEGHVILGDSHEYDDDIDPFDRRYIEELLLRELRKAYCLPDWTIDARWTGVYAKCTEGPWFTCSPAPQITIINGLGGAGMSLGLAVSEQIVKEQCQAPESTAL